MRRSAPRCAHCIELARRKKPRARGDCAVGATINRRFPLIRCREGDKLNLSAAGAVHVYSLSAGANDAHRSISL